MSIKNLKNNLLEIVRMDRNPVFNIMVKENVKSDEHLKKTTKNTSSIESNGKVKEFVVSEVVELSFDQWNKICLFNEAITVYNQFDISWSLLTFNLNDLKLYITQNLSKKTILNEVEKEGCLRALNSKLVNASSSIYIYIIITM